MNYIKLVNQFWQVRRSCRITNLQADLYFFLLQECNERGWKENPFQVSNISVMAGISVAMSSLQDARKKLVEYGLITFEPGVKNITNPSYGIVEFIADIRHRNRKWTGNETGESPVIPSAHNNINENGKRKQKIHSAGPAEPAKKKSISDTTEHWKKLVDVWFKFYELKFEIEPTFDGSAAKNLQRIVKLIKKACDDKKPDPIPWSEENAARALDHFLKKAYADKWLKANFMLKNLYSNFDKIVTPTNNGTQQTASAKGATIDDIQNLKQGPGSDTGTGTHTE